MCIRDRIKRAWLFCCNTGLGYSDCKMLKWDQIRDGHITGMRAKNRSNEVPLNDTAMSMIGDRIGDYVFDLPSESYLTKVMRDWCDKAEVRRFTFYSARHYCATRLVEAGVDLPTVRKIMGHASLKYILRYVDVSREKKIDAVNRLD